MTTTEKTKEQKIMELVSYDALIHMDIKNLKILNSLVVDAINRVNGRMRFQVKQSIRVGMEVRVDAPQLGGMSSGTIIKLNPKKAKVKMENGAVWNVPYSMLIY